MAKPTEPFTVAAVEFNPALFDFDGNLTRALGVIREAAEHGARLIVLPEAALSGYIYRDLDELRPFLDEVPGRATAAIAEITAEHGCFVAIGISEIDPATGLAYNTGALVGPDGYIGKYRKNGLNPSDVVWFAPGNTGYPVFETELGRICMIICYDDTYWEPARVPAIKGADLIAYICSSDRVIDEHGIAAINHSTIAAVQQLCAWNGLAMVCADRNNAETNPSTGVTVVYGGSASVWQADGELVVQASATDANTTSANPGTILYGTIDPARYDNDQRATLARRRPELYHDLTFHRSPTDTAATALGTDVALAAAQYRVAPGDVDGNLARAEALVEQVIAGGVEPGLLVLPAFSLHGVPADAASAAAQAEDARGRTTQTASEFAARTGRHVVASHVERAGERLYHRVVLMAPDGTEAGAYRQTHLDPAFADWATAGDDLPVFETALGRVGLLACEDARFPEASGVLCVRRADLIALPTWWDGGYGGPLRDASGLFEHGYPANTMCLWYAIAKTTQAYTVVANASGEGCLGSSGIFTLNPVDSREVPVVASSGESELVQLRVRTLGDPTSWMDQQRVVIGRRADLAVPLMLPAESEALRRWRDAPGFDVGAWAAYMQTSK